MTAITGTATTPLMTALQYSAWIGSTLVKLTPTPISDASATVTVFGAAKLGYGAH